jgi:ribosomal-protein-alanine N-acetyltransferase
MFGRAKKPRVETERLSLRLPVQGDYAQWRRLRENGVEFLQPWEPKWAHDHLSRKAFSNRVYWAQRSVGSETAVPLFLTRRADNVILGALTLDNIRRGPAQAGTVGYWIGAEYARQGYMREALAGVVHYAFAKLDLSRVEAACLPENLASRGVLEKAGFKYEGVAQSYLQINGRWRNHVLYSSLRNDRRGATHVGLA